MRITCDAYIEPSSQGARLGRAQNFRPTVCKGTSIAVDRDEARDVCLFVGKSPGNRPHLVSKVDDIVDIDARQVTDGRVGIRFAAPPVLVLVYNTRALLLEDFVRLLRKLTERSKIGTAVRFRYTPEQVLDSQRIEREQAAAVSTLHASNGESAPVVTALGSWYASAARSTPHAHPVPLPTRTSPYASPSKSVEGAGRPNAHAPEGPLKTVLDGEIDGLRRAMASESRDRGSLLDRIARLERENSYLNAQLQMEQKKQGDYREATREAKKLAEGAETKLKDKQRELHDRTEELIEERNGRQDMMEEGLRRMQEVESYTVNSMQHVRNMQRRVAGMMAQRLEIRVLLQAVRRWRSQATCVIGRMELLRNVHQRFVNQVLGRPLMCWKKQAELVLYLSAALPRLALRRRRNLLAQMFRLWRVEAWRSARAKMFVAMEDLKAGVAREHGLAAQLREAEEMLAEAYAAQSDVEKAVREQTQRRDRDVQEARDLMEAALIEERRVRVQLEEVSKELKASKSAEKITRATLEEHIQSHKQEAEVLRERLRAAESAFDGMKRKLNESQAKQQDLEDMVATKSGLASDKNVKMEMLQQTVKELETQSVRLLQQLQSEEASRARAEGARQSMQAKLEELERSGSVMVRGRQAVQTEYDDERKRRVQLEDALAKLIKAFKEAKEEHRQKLMHAGDYVRMLAAFFEWRRAAELSAQATAQATLEYRRQEMEEAFRSAASTEKAFRSAASTEKAALGQSAHELRDAVQRLSADLEDSREREEEARAACASLEAQLASLKETYLKGVKASVQSIRQCRDKYLPANASTAESD